MTSLARYQLPVESSAVEIPSEAVKTKYLLWA